MPACGPIWHLLTQDGIAWGRMMCAEHAPEGGACTFEQPGLAHPTGGSRRQLLRRGGAVLAGSTASAYLSPAMRTVPLVEAYSATPGCPRWLPYQCKDMDHSKDTDHPKDIEPDFDKGNGKGRDPEHVQHGRWNRPGWEPRDLERWLPRRFRDS